MDGNRRSSVGSSSAVSVERTNNLIERSKVLSIQLSFSTVCTEGRKQMLKYSQFFPHFESSLFQCICIRLCVCSFFAIPSIPFHFDVVASFRYIQGIEKVWDIWLYFHEPYLFFSSIQWTSPTDFPCGFWEYSCRMSCQMHLMSWDDGNGGAQLFYSM